MYIKISAAVMSLLRGTKFGTKLCIIGIMGTKLGAAAVTAAARCIWTWGGGRDNLLMMRLFSDSIHVEVSIFIVSP
jgi:hypothetical protein